MATTLDLELHVIFAALHPDGSILLELAVGDADDLVKVTMPPSDYSRRLAREVVVPLDLDELMDVSPRLVGEIDSFIAELRSRLIARQIVSVALN